MTCILTGCLIRISNQDRIYSSDCFAVGESLVWVTALQPRDDVTVPDVVINCEDRFHFWERPDENGRMVYVAAQPALSQMSSRLEEAVDRFFEQWFQTLPADSVVELDRYEPDYDQKCQSCGNYPTVTGVKDGQKVLDLGLCGPCTWGEAQAADPSSWN